MNADADKVIRFCNADEEHQFIVDKTLSNDQGLTFDVFKDAEEEPVVEEPTIDPVTGEEIVVEK